MVLSKKKKSSSRLSALDKFDHAIDSDDDELRDDMDVIAIPPEQPEALAPKDLAPPSIGRPVAEGSPSGFKSPP